MKPKTPITTRSEMGDWHVDQAARGWPSLPKTKRRKLSPKDQCIAELKEEVRRLKEQIKQERLDRALTNPKTGRPYDLIARARDTRAALDS